MSVPNVEPWRRDRHHIFGFLPAAAAMYLVWLHGGGSAAAVPRLEGPECASTPEVAGAQAPVQDPCASTGPERALASRISANLLMWITCRASEARTLRGVLRCQPI